MSTDHVTEILDSVHFVEGFVFCWGVDKTHEIIKIQSYIFIVELNGGNVSPSMENAVLIPPLPVEMSLEERQG